MSPRPGPSTLLVFAYVDIFGFWRADVINGALAGETWTYYLIGSGIELVLLAAIAYVAFRWR